MSADAGTRAFAAAYLGIVILTVLTFTVAKAADPHVPGAAAVAEFIGLDQDLSFAELLGYGAAFIAAANFFVLYVDRRSRCLLFLAVLVSFLGIDDSMSYHERVGRELVAAFDLPAAFGLRRQDTGEILAWAMAALGLGALLAWSLPRAGARDLGILCLVAAPILLLGFCGALLDLLHIVVPGPLGTLVGVAEDGGELLALALIAIVSMGASRNADAYYAGPVSRRR